MPDFKDHAKEAIEQGADHAKKAVDSVAARTGDALSEVRHYAEPRLAEAQAGFRDFADQGQQGFRYAERYVRGNPGQSVAAVLGVGIALGVLIGLNMASRRY
jgi:ElaB/YqjD/DUF883 family membrane-anchored ribosome-binding protein